MAPIPIDIVYTWVNGSDPILRKSLAEYKRRFALEHGETVDNSTDEEAEEQVDLPSLNITELVLLYGNGTLVNGTVIDANLTEAQKKLKDYASASRFRDNNELMYSLRSLERFAPWVRHIFLVTNGQVPTWLDVTHPRITVVSHEEIFDDQSHLPTFSSPAIEVHLHKIPGLSEKFIYFNDDVMFGSEVWPDDFYTHAGGQKVYFSWAVPNCADGCPASWINDGVCDRACNNSACDFDGSDCINATASNTGNYNQWWSQSQQQQSAGQASPTLLFCAPGCPDTWIGDRYCDKACQNLECGYDATDCNLDVMREKMVGIDAAINMSNFDVPPRTPAMYVNLTHVFGAGKITEGSHDNSAIVRTATITQRYKVMTLTFHRNISRQDVTISVVGTQSEDQNAPVIELTFNITVDTIMPPENATEAALNATAAELDTPGPGGPLRGVTFLAAPRPSAGEAPSSSPAVPLDPSSAERAAQQQRAAQVRCGQRHERSRSHAAEKQGTGRWCTVVSRLTLRILFVWLRSFAAQLVRVFQTSPVAAPSATRSPIAIPIEGQGLGGGSGSGSRGGGGSGSGRPWTGSGSGSGSGLGKGSGSGSGGGSGRGSGSGSGSGSRPGQGSGLAGTGSGSGSRAGMGSGSGSFRAGGGSGSGFRAGAGSGSGQRVGAGSPPRVNANQANQGAGSPGRVQQVAPSRSREAAPADDTSPADNLNNGSADDTDEETADGRVGDAAAAGDADANDDEAERAPRGDRDKDEDDVRDGGRRLLAVDGRRLREVAAAAVGEVDSKPRTARSEAQSGNGEGQQAKESGVLGSQAAARRTEAGSREGLPRQTLAGPYSALRRIRAAMLERQNSRDDGARAADATGAVPEDSESQEGAAVVRKQPKERCAYFDDEVFAEDERGSVVIVDDISDAPRSRHRIEITPAHPLFHSLERDGSDPHVHEEVERGVTADVVTEDPPPGMCEADAELWRWISATKRKTLALEEEARALAKHAPPPPIVRMPKQDLWTMDSDLFPWEAPPPEPVVGRELVDDGAGLRGNPARRRLLDVFGDSLKFVNKIYNREFGQTARKVPAHMPHMIDKSIMSRLQARWPAEYDRTSGNHVRRPDDMQMAFAYFYYLIHERKEFTVEGYFKDEIDVDGDGLISHNELRTLGARVLKHPLSRQALQEMHDALADTAEDMGKPAFPEEFTVEVLNATASVMELIRKHANSLRANKHEVKEIDEVAFFMIGDNDTEVLRSLDDIRLKRNKFVCLNDNMGDDANQKVVQALQDLFRAFFPHPSQFELPPGTRNAFTYISDYRAVEHQRSRLKQLGIFALVVLAVGGVALFATESGREFWRDCLARQAQRWQRREREQRSRRLLDD